MIQNPHADADKHQKITTSRGSSLAHACRVCRRPLPRLWAILLTESMTERSHHITSANSVPEWIRRSYCRATMEHSRWSVVAEILQRGRIKWMCRWVQRRVRCGTALQFVEDIRPSLDRPCNAARRRCRHEWRWTVVSTLCDSRSWSDWVVDRVTSARGENRRTADPLPPVRSRTMTHLWCSERC